MIVKRMLGRCVPAIIFAAVVMAGVDLMFSREAGTDNYTGEQPKYTTVISGAMLPISFFVIVLTYSFLYSAQIGLHLALSNMAVMFLEIGIYYMLLLPLLPRLRERVNARSVAFLWFVPNWLYITTLYKAYDLNAPLFVIKLPPLLFNIIVFLWLGGFCVIMIYYIAQHISFRRYILKDARPVTDERVLDIWKATFEEAQLKKYRYKLVISDKVKTPLSIGMEGRAVRVVLPPIDYTDEELGLILKHEAIHILRGDSWAKFFSVFCCAACWFNPFMWKAMSKSAEDMELSCDETVLIGADDTTRKKYADLILSTAGDKRGFTTCLSASAESMLYRLKNIVKPKDKYNGTGLLGAMFCIMALCHGLVAFGYDEKTGAEYIYGGIDYSQYRLRDVEFADNDYFNDPYDYEVKDEKAVLKYLSDLKLTRLAGKYTTYSDESVINFYLNGPQGRVRIYLAENTVSVRVQEVGEYEYIYHIPDGIDTEYLRSMVIPYPSLKVDLVSEDGVVQNNPVFAGISKLEKNTDGVTVEIYKHIQPGMIDTGFYGHGMDTVQLKFSKELSTPLTMVVENPDTGESYTVSRSDTATPFTTKLNFTPARCKVYADYIGDEGDKYSAEFIFSIDVEY